MSFGGVGPNASQRDERPPDVLSVEDEYSADTIPRTSIAPTPRPRLYCPVVEKFDHYQGSVKHDAYDMVYWAGNKGLEESKHDKRLRSPSRPATTTLACITNERAHRRGKIQGILCP